MKNSICEKLHIPEEDDWLCEAGKDCKNKECKWYKKNLFMIAFVISSEAAENDNLPKHLEGTK